MERWENAVEGYEVSDHGNCRRLLHNGKYQTITGSIMNRGYRYFQLQRDGKRINYLIHQLVAKAFIGERPDGLVIDHIDRDKTNNHVSNLRYITQGDNSRNQDRYRTDILEADRRIRNNILCMERDRRIGRVKGNTRPKGTGQLYERNGRIRVCLTMDKVRYNYTCDTTEQAECFIAYTKASHELRYIDSP